MPKKSIARKKKQIESGEPSQIRPFESEAAENRYKSTVSKRVVSAEKGFVLKNTRDLGYPSFIYSVIKKLGWQTLCFHSSDFCTTVVKEFYANLMEKHQELVYVRGRAVSIEGHNINICFGIEIETDEHSNFVGSANDTELASVLSDLCAAGTEWSTSSQGAMTVFRTELKPEVKVWYHFLKASLMPTLHLQTVSKERLLLLHSIIKRRKIDIGAIIQREICDCAQKQKARLYFPCLITKLCELSGVPMHDGDERLTNKGAITRHTITRIMQEVEVEQPQEEQEEIESDREAGPSAAPQPQQNFSLNQLERRVSLLEEAQFAHQEEQRAFWKYVEARDNALQKNLRASSKRFFSFPAFPGHILQQSDEDEGNAERP